MHNRAFTIVETLVAVAVLMIAVAGPLTIANKGLKSALIARNEVIASYLAQDALEVAKFIRDNDYLQDSTSWLLGDAGNIKQCTSSSKCTIDVNPSSLAITVGTSGSDLLFLTGEGKYTHSASVPNTQTIFHRQLWLETADVNGPEYEIVVNVSWPESGTTFTHVLRSTIFKALP